MNHWMRRSTPKDLYHLDIPWWFIYTVAVFQVYSIYQDEWKIQVVLISLIPSSSFLTDRSIEFECLIDGLRYIGAILATNI